MGKNRYKTKTKPALKASQDDIDIDSNHDTSPSMREERFIAAEIRPQFIAPSPNVSKVVLDSRFSSVLTNSRFRLQQKDKYGRKKRKKNGSSTAKEELESFYVVDNQEVDPKNSLTKSQDEDENNSGASKSAVQNSNEGYAVENVSRIAYLTAFSRGEVDASSSLEESDSSESSSDDDDHDSDKESVYEMPGVLDLSTKGGEEIELSCDISPYMVVMNLDWENVRAVDIFCILSSFAPPGAIKNVQVYQSDFGTKQMAKEKLYGPTGLWQNETSTQEVLPLRGGSIDVEDSNKDDFESQKVSEDELIFEQQNFSKESDFNSEKLRAYETSKLRYYFAVTEVVQDYVDIIYREVDGMEFEHSSTAIDLRILPQSDFEDIISNRPMQDEATSIPCKYEPPDFIVSALQQTNVQCTWDQGDKEREKKLTKHRSSNWQESFEADDLKAYIASDVSSDEDSDEDDDMKADKKLMIRKALGLDSDRGSSADSSDDESSARDLKGNEQDNHINEDITMSKEVKVLPDKKNLEERIRSKLDLKETKNELTPWEKYQETRKQKRKERRQKSRGNKLSSKLENETGSKATDILFASSFGSNRDVKPPKKVRNSKLKLEKHNGTGQVELLLAGEYIEEEARNYDIRGIQRLEKNKGKKFTGSRKRKEAKIAVDIPGSNFKINVNDDRFRALLDGNDARFGIDKTDPNFKDTTSMREILNEQLKRRKNKRYKKTQIMENRVGHDGDKIKSSNWKKEKSGANALSLLAQKLKSQVKY